MQSSLCYSTPQPKERIVRSECLSVESPLRRRALDSLLGAEISDSIRNGNKLKIAVETTICNAVKRAVGLYTITQPIDESAIDLFFVQKMLCRERLDHEPFKMEDLIYDLTLVEEELRKDTLRKRNMSSEDRIGALDVAASFGAAPIVRLLLRHDQEITWKEYSFNSFQRGNATLLAAGNGHEGVVYELINSGFIDCQQWSSAIRKALRKGFESVALVLALHDPLIHVPNQLHAVQRLLWNEEANNLFLQAASSEGNQRFMGILLSKYPISASTLGRSLRYFYNYEKEMLSTILKALEEYGPIEQGYIAEAIKTGASHGHSVSLQLLLDLCKKNDRSCPIQ